MCFGEPQNDLWPFLKDPYEFPLERFGYESIKIQAIVFVQVYKDIPDSFVVFDYIYCGI